MHRWFFGKIMFKSLFGKYRFLVISIALFLIFDLGVLVLNFYTSGQIAEQTERINLAGRQRTLTQQMSKATLYIKAQKLQLWVYQSGLDELRDHYNTFGETLKVFNEGGTVQSADTGLPVQIEPVQSAEGKSILVRANRLWKEFETAIDPLMVDILVTDEEIIPASEFIARKNGELFSIMDELTEYFTQTAESQTTLLRRAQVIGISLATINFFIILFHFLGQLRGRDQELQIKQHESDQILSTIGEGVFLVNKQLVMSGQHSKQLEEIFATSKLSGRRFQRFLAEFFPSKTVETAVYFIKLFYRDHVDPDLIADVNPLKRIEAVIKQRSGESERKYLDFSFAKLDQGADESVVLVTVQDVTAKILLEEQDQASENDLEQQMALLTQMLPIPQTELQQFINESLEGYDRINGLLKDTKYVNDNFEKTLTRISREAHKLKGNAAALDFDWVAEQMHGFEEQVETLRQQARVRTLCGQDLLPLTIQLRESYDSIEQIGELHQKLASYGQGRARKVVDNDLKEARAIELNQPLENKKWFDLRAFTDRIARDKGIAVELNLRGFSKPISSELTDVLYPAAIQLVRNSIAHGIETESTRQDLRKPNHGQITISVSHDKKGNYRFLFEDDGRGFDYEGIRNSLIDKGLLNERDATALGKTALVRHAFKDAVSSTAKTDQLSGRGAGLPVVWQQIKQLGGLLKIRSVENEFTQFIVDFKRAPAFDYPGNNSSNNSLARKAS